MACAARDHALAEHRGDDPHALDVDRQDAIDRRGVGDKYRAVERDTGVGEDDVHRSEFGLDRFGQRRDGGIVANVARVSAGIVAEPGRNLARLFKVDVADRHPAAFRVERLGDSAADARRAARDERQPVSKGEPAHVVLLTT